MVRTFVFVSALALSSAAMAQDQAAPAAEAAPAPVEQAAPVDAAAQTAQPAAKADVAAVVAAEFPTYDADKSGDLDQAEFSKWLIALKTQAEAGKATQSADELDKWAGAAFAQADADKSSKVSQAELTSFLQG
ncbi:MAG: hypothetical protein ABS87_13305 [Sphingomonas sp. SCN 67-18]|uniref:EF-hand domain-containing protein n=1 Tax=uncultured Sphingomonas sp. TaxID=158754 RepID=UPI00086B0042|nr:EF-hand domain-containing protein [Sphingomonas sp. SCN 67-18]ODU19746.1 MAG: hypothetical protein ABS87_13305 [Sphingomonas sp. SCN 67-18]